MSTYELDDHDVQRILECLPDTQMDKDIRDRIITQIPIPVPVKVGAVVRTLGAISPLDQPVTFVRWALDHFTHSPWLQANNDTPFRTDEIGRITEVLSPGVDL